MKKHLQLICILVLVSLLTKAQTAQHSHKLGNGFNHLNPSVENVQVQFFVIPMASVQAVVEKLELIGGFESSLIIQQDLYAEGFIHKSQLDKLVSIPEIEVVDVIMGDLPEAIHDRQAAVRSNWLNSAVTGLNFDGTGVTIALRESGSVTDYDINFASRQKDAFEVGDVAGHKDGVAAHMAGAGNVNPRHIGVAPGSDFYDLPISGIDFNSLYDNQKVKYVNRSSGKTISEAIYNLSSRNRDQNVYNNPEMLFVYSAGNSNGKNGNYDYGPYSSLAGTEFATITLDEKMSKNNIVAQSVTQYDGGYGLGSRGPTYDGRIKPDLTADGELGTSHAAPKITGVLALLNQAYQHHYGTYPESALLKAILFNSADDHGRKGPDFRYGYGKMNTRRAYNCLKDGRFFTDTIEQGQEQNYQVSLPADSSEAVEFKVTLTWCDPAAVGVPTPDTALVNNLDLTLSVGDTTFLPWVLNTFPHEDSLKLNATRGVDYLNNTEQITFMVPSQYLGQTITIKVTGAKLDVSHPKQNYYLAYEIVKKELVLTTPLGGEQWKPLDEQIIRWDAYGITSNFQIKYREVGAAEWDTLANVPNDKRYYKWDIPDVAQFYFKSYEFQIVTVSDTMSYQSQAVEFAPVPKNLTHKYSCDNTHYFTWDLLDTTDVTYHMHYLDGKYMVKQPIDFSDTLAYCESIYPHFAISATRNGVSSRRSLAISPDTDSAECVLTNTDELSVLDFSLFPNPASNEVTLQLPNLHGDICLVSMVSLEGRVLFSEYVQRSQFSIDTRKFDAGMYLVTVEMNEERQVQRLVLRK